MINTLFNYITDFIRGLTTFQYVFVICVIFIVCLTFIKNFLKANKGDTDKVNKLPCLLGVAICLIVLAGISSIR